MNKEIANKKTNHPDAAKAEQKLKVTLVGNPNVGKSCFFNYFSGVYVDVSNFPGTTVSVSKCVYKEWEINDSPGIYGVSSFNEEEKVARSIIMESDVILNIVNALHLERDLFLTRQLIDMGLKVSVVLNFCDELKKQKIRINTEKLSELLGVNVYETTAIDKAGFENLDDAINNARVGYQSPELAAILKPYIEKTGSQSSALLLLEGDSQEMEKFGTDKNIQANREKAYISRRTRVNEIVDQVEWEDTKKGEFFNQIGKLSLNPWTALPLMVIVLSIMYFLIGDLVSQKFVSYTENKIGKKIFEYNVKSFIALNTPTYIDVTLLDENGKPAEKKTYSFDNGLNGSPGLAAEFKKYSSLPNADTDFRFTNKFYKLFFGEFGVITMTITYLLFLLAPLVIAFYFLMAILEDSGYLPRLATMLDRTFNKLGLNGKAVIPIILGFGCITMANITTRMLGTEKEKTIVTAILQFAIPCSAQLAVLTVLLSGAGFMPMIIFICVIGTILIILSSLLNKFLPGESSPLLLDLPAMRLPRMNNVFKKTIFRSIGFMKEASFWFFIGALGIGIMQITGLLNVWINLLEPVTTAWLKLPKEAATAFVMGMVRRDFGAAGLFDLNLTNMQITVAIITITLFVPCIASFVVMLKERGWKEGISIWIGTWITAFIVGGIVAQIII
jgi:ferrous iron transport protein B